MEASRKLVHGSFHHPGGLVSLPDSLLEAFDDLWREGCFPAAVADNGGNVFYDQASVIHREGVSNQTILPLARSTNFARHVVLRNR